jgi:hypothetical protein
LYDLRQPICNAGLNGVMVDSKFNVDEKNDVPDYEVFRGLGDSEVWKKDKFHARTKLWRFLFFCWQNNFQGNHLRRSNFDIHNE